MTLLVGRAGSTLLEHPLPVPRQIVPMTRTETAHAQRLVQTKQAARRIVEGARDDDIPVVIQRDEPAIESCVQVRREQDSVPDVEALGVCFAVGPGLDVAAAEQLGDGESGESAAALPVLEQALSEEILADPLDHEALCFRGAGEHGGLLLEGVEQLVR